MFICTECGTVVSIENMNVTYEQHPYGMGVANEEVASCPNCGEISLVPAIKCCRCDTYIERQEAKIDDNINYICKTCYSDLYD